MKKLKIFLLLGILLCLGFALSPEVHAQGNGPKVFEVGDILPATTQLRITFTNLNAEEISMFTIFTNSGSTFFMYNGGVLSNIYITSGSFGNKVFNPPYDTQKYVDVDISNLSLEERTISFVEDTAHSHPTWEDLNAPTEPSNAKHFEIGDELPAGYIKISWDFTGKPIPEETMTFVVSSGDDVFNDFIMQIHFEWGIRRVIDIYYEGSLEFLYVDTPGYTIIELTESVTITDLEGTTGATSVDYNVYIGGALTWEVVSQDYFDGFISAREFYGFREIGGYWISGEQAWNNGYDSGSGESWDEGYEYGMETFGYYDSTTDEWLSVSEYLELYGTDKPGQSDFYGNFDKYFIPAMIIVFGGAIVLTILKVFKGRE